MEPVRNSPTLCHELGCLHLYTTSTMIFFTNLRLWVDKKSFGELTALITLTHSEAKQMMGVTSEIDGKLYIVIKT